MSNETDSDNMAYTEFGLYKAGILIWKVVPPILILVGTIGNSLSILVLTRRSIRVSTTALFLTVLACSDLLVLYSGLLRQWLIYLFDTDVRHISEAGCKISMWLVYSSLDFSAWILILVTLERVVLAWFPHHGRIVSNRKSAVACLAVICGFILGINAHMLYGMVFKIEYDSNNNPYLHTCTVIDDAYYRFFSQVWPWIDLSVFCVVPFAVIVIGNTMILFKVLQSKKKTRSSIRPMGSLPNSQTKYQSNNNGKKSSMTVVLFTLNIVFIVTTSPVSIYNIGYAYWGTDMSDANTAKLDFWWAVKQVNKRVNSVMMNDEYTKEETQVISRAVW
ncbi:neuromedin-U receptor 2-like [Dreissena polymorpha]|uniref:neuromedin-U receptor 2-like n=1 Tax=Dreissena polymorpha TaxID=45954 RepID=UPI0022645168|nr:neuromedin-U receptor 2-like [Dreissena polymorpha]